MSDFLDKDDYVPYAPESTGKVRINHNSYDCSGESNSLVIERNTDGTISAKCFRCGRYGRYSESFYSNSAAKKEAVHAASRTRHSYVTLPSDGSTELSEWRDSRARIRILRYGLTAKEIKDNGIVYSDKLRGIVFPCSDSSGMVGYQVRTFDEELPKYYTKTIDPDRMVWYRRNTSNSNACVLVEDVLSGIKTSRHLSTACLLGTELNAGTLARILEEGHREFIIYLDDDNPIVRAKQRVLKNKLELYGTVRIIHNRGVDPKELSNKELVEILL